jgi:hypothetical protein
MASARAGQHLPHCILARRLELLRLAFAQLRFRPGRSVALLVVLMATVACFALVGASAKTEQVTVHGTLEAALIMQPGLLLADEPTGNLDSATGAEIIDLLLALNAEHGTTLVIATHDPAIAERCQHVIRMRDGRITSQPPVSVDDDVPAANRA